MIQQHVSEQTAKTIDYFSFAGAVAVVAGVLPVLVGVATLIWTCIRIWEMETTQKFVSWLKSKKGE
jgi:hypothetical protein